MKYQDLQLDKIWTFVASSFKSVKRIVDLIE